MPKTRGSVQIKEDPDAVPRKIAKKPKDQTDDADREKIVELLNDAATEPEASRLLDFLSEIQERIVFKDSGLLDDWLDEVVQYQTHVSQDVRKWVVGFIEESCKKDPEILTRVITNLRIMMNDQAISVRKRVIQAMTFLYKLCLKWLCTVKFINENMEAVWQGITEMKNSIVAMVHSDNDGNF